MLRSIVTIAANSDRSIGEQHRLRTLSVRARSDEVFLPYRQAVHIGPDLNRSPVIEGRGRKHAFILDWLRTVKSTTFILVEPCQ